MAAASASSSVTCCARHLPEGLFKALGGDEGIAKGLSKGVSLTESVILGFAMLEITTKEGKTMEVSSVQFVERLATRVSKKKIGAHNSINVAQIKVEEQEEITRAIVNFIIQFLSSK